MEENEEKDGEKEEGWRIGEVNGKWRENVTGKSEGWRGQVEEWRMGQRANIEVDEKAKTLMLTSGVCGDRRGEANSLVWGRAWLRRLTTAAAEGGRATGGAAARDERGSYKSTTL